MAKIHTEILKWCSQFIFWHSKDTATEKKLCTTPGNSQSLICGPLIKIHLDFDFTCQGQFTGHVKYYSACKKLLNNVWRSIVKCEKIIQVTLLD